MHLVASVCLSVKVKFLACSGRYAISNTYKYQSKVIVCNQWAFVDNHADAVDWLLILGGFREFCDISNVQD